MLISTDIKVWKRILYSDINVCVEDQIKEQYTNVCVVHTIDDVSSLMEAFHLYTCINVCKSIVLDQYVARNKKNVN